MKYTITILTTLIIFANGIAQQKFNPVHWTTQVKKVDANHYDIVFTAKLDTGWELYSQFLDNDSGPLPTTFIFQKNESYNRIDAVKEGWANKKKVYDKMFDMTVVKYSKSAVFTQRVKATNSGSVLVMIEYMSCRAISCLPPRYVEFDIDLSKTTVQQPSNFVD
jgi:thiol:disulfide interchange protein DsbD